MNEWKKVFQHFKDLNGWNTQQLCDTLGVHATQISSWGYGHTEPTWSVILKMARRLDTDIVEFIALWQMAKQGRMDAEELQLLDYAKSTGQQVFTFYCTEQGIGIPSNEEADKSGGEEDRGNRLLGRG